MKLFYFFIIFVSLTNTMLGMNIPKIELNNEQIELIESYNRYLRGYDLIDIADRINNELKKEKELTDGEIKVLKDCLESFKDILKELKRKQQKMQQMQRSTQRIDTPRLMTYSQIPRNTKQDLQIQNQNYNWNGLLHLTAFGMCSAISIYSYYKIDQSSHYWPLVTGVGFLGTLFTTLSYLKQGNS